jgi:hypothetical protein
MFSQKKFYSECVALTAPQHVAAFKESLFLHRFIGDFRLNKNSPTFLADQRIKLATYDARKARASQKGPAILVPPPRPTTPTPPPNIERAKVTVVSPARPAVAGPGPQTMANSSNAREIPRPEKSVKRSTLATSFGPGKVREPLPEYRRKFKDIEESGSGSESENEVVSPPVRPRPFVLMTTKSETRAEKEKRKEKERKKEEKAEKERERKKEEKAEKERERKKEERAEKERERRKEERAEKEKERKKEEKAQMKERKDETSEKGTVVRVKRAVITRKSDAHAADDSDSSDDSDEDDDSRPYKATVKQETKGRPIVPTGKLYDPPCVRCGMAEKACEMQEGGTACVGCRRSKHKCEYGQPRRKVEKKSKATLETEDDETEGGRQHPPRRAAKAANAAIDEIISGKIAPKSTPKTAPQPAKKGEYFPFLQFLIATITLCHFLNLYLYLGKANITRTSAAVQIADLAGKVDDLTTMVERLSDFLGLKRTISGNQEDPPTKKAYEDKNVQTEDEPSRPPSILPAPSRPPSPLPVPIGTPAHPSTPMPPPALLPSTMAESVPGVKVIEATPLNSQDAAMVDEAQPTQTPPPSTENSSPSLPLPSLLAQTAAISKSTDAPGPSTAATIENPVDASPLPSQPASSLMEQVTDPAPIRRRSRTPRPVSADTLQVPIVSPPRTRSRTRSRSPTPLAGKRKVDKDAGANPNSKKRRT